MTPPPVQNLDQELEYDKYTMRIQELILVTNANLLELEHRNNTEATELKAFRTSLCTIEQGAAIANSTLCDWKVLEIEKMLNKANNKPYDATQSEPKTPETPLTNKTSTHLQPGAMKAIQPISDETIKTDPDKAVTWFLQF